MTPRELALRLAVISVVADRAKEIKDGLRAEVLASLDEIGADSASATLPDGTKVAKVGIVAPKPRVRVLNEQAYTDHVAQEHPDEIVRSVRESFSRHYLETLLPTDDGQAVDPRTGAIVPGVVFTEATPYPSLRFEKTGRDEVIHALSEGLLTLDLGPHIPELGA